MAEPEGSRHHAREHLSLPLSDVMRILDKSDVTHSFLKRMTNLQSLVQCLQNIDTVSDTVCSHAHVKDTLQMREGELCYNAVQAKSTLTQGDIIRLAPPLIISKEQILECADIIHTTVASFDASLTADHPVQAA